MAFSCLNVVEPHANIHHLFDYLFKIGHLPLVTSKENTLDQAKANLDAAIHQSIAASRF